MNKFAILLLATVLSASAAEPALKVSLLEKNILCIRATQIPDDFAEQLQSSLPTNQLSGAVLDLRFADGSQTVSTENFPLGQKFPLVILVNGETSGGAAELATKLRAENQGIIIGSTNATSKVTPDIVVAEDSATEKMFQQNPFARPPESHAGLAATNNDLLPLVDHMNEAELVRKHAKDGDLDEPNLPRVEPKQPVIRDPELARAADLLKALAFFRAAKNS